MPRTPTARPPVLCSAQAFRRVFDKAVPHTWRIVNEKDVVPTVPTPPRYAHVGKEVRVDGNGLMMLQPSFLERQHHQEGKDRVQSHYLPRYRKSLEAIAEEMDMQLSLEVAPYGKLWELDCG